MTITLSPKILIFGKPFFKPITYDPGYLLDALNRKLKLRNDAALCIELEIGAPIISKIRNRRSPVSGSILIRMHEVSGLSIEELRMLMGDRRQQFRIFNGPYESKQNSTAR